MAQPNKPSCSCSNPSMLNDPDKAKDKKSSGSEGLNPHNMVWATKHHDKNHDELVILQFDDAIMQAIGLKSKNKGKPAK